MANDWQHQQNCAGLPEIERLLATMWVLSGWHAVAAMLGLQRNNLVEGVAGVEKLSY